MSNKKRIICYGELLFDCYGSIEKGFTPKFGGAPCNAAVGLARLGYKNIAFAGKVGNDFFGDSLEKSLKDYKVDAKNLFRSEDFRTTLAFVSLGAKGERDFSFFRGAHETISLKEAQKIKLDDALVLQFGSLTQINKVCFEATDYLIKKARQKKIFISYDPNVRLSLWDDKKRLKKVILDTIPMVDSVKVNEEELYFLTGSKDIKKGTQKLWKKNLQLLVVTLGEKGAYWKTAKGEGLVKGKEVKAIDTTGAGDAFNGGILFKLAPYIEKGKLSIAEDKLVESVSFANGVAALATLKKGAVEALPMLKEVEKFIKK